MRRRPGAQRCAPTGPWAWALVRGLRLGQVRGDLGELLQGRLQVLDDLPGDRVRVT